MALSSAMSKVAFVNKLPLLMKATSADATPPAGHVYNDIARITFESLEQTDVLVDFLVERLKKSSPYIKWKVLLIMKSVLRNGHEEFRHALRRQYHGIREAKSFNGPPDPLHGDAPYVNVRTAAGEVLQVLFDTDYARNEPKTSIKSSSSSSSLSSSIPGEVPKKMEGFGSSNFRDQSGDVGTKLDSSQTSRDSSSRDMNLFNYAVQRVKDNISYAFGENVSALAKYQQNEEHNEGGYRQFFDTDRKLVTRPSQTFNVFGNGSADKDGDSQESSEELNHGTASTLHATDESSDPAFNLPERVPSPGRTPEAEVEEDWLQEESAVNTITALGGRLNPGRPELHEFTKRCEVLNFEKIVELLDKKLESNDYRVQMKTLIVIESMFHSGISNSQDLFASKFTSRFEMLRSSHQKAVRAKSTKLLHMLQPQQEKAEAENALPMEEKQNPNSQLVDLLSDLDVSNSNSTEKKSQEPAGMASVASLLIDETEKPIITENAEVQNTNSYDLLASLVSQDQKLIVNEGQSSSSSDLLDLDPFSGIDSIVSDTQSQQTFSGLPVNDAPTGDKPSQSTTSNLNFDPFSLDALSSSATQSSTTETPHPPNSSFDFLQLESNTMQKSSLNHTQPSMSIMNDPLQPQILQPIVNHQQSAQTRQFASQYQSLSQQRPLLNQVFTGSDGRMSFSTPQPMMSNRPFVPAKTVSRQGTTNLNGFDFITSGKKPGAFDFVRDAMEASKRK